MEILIEIDELVNASISSSSFVIRHFRFVGLETGAPGGIGQIFVPQFDELIYIQLLFILYIYIEKKDKKKVQISTCSKEDFHIGEAVIDWAEVYFLFKSLFTLFFILPVYSPNFSQSLSFSFVSILLSIFRTLFANFCLFERILNFLR